MFASCVIYIYIGISALSKLRHSTNSIALIQEHAKQIRASHYTCWRSLTGSLTSSHDHCDDGGGVDVEMSHERFGTIGYMSAGVSEKVYFGTCIAYDKLNHPLEFLAMRTSAMIAEHFRAVIVETFIHDCVLAFAAFPICFLDRVVTAV